MISVAVAAGIEDVVKKLKETNPNARIIYK